MTPSKATQTRPTNGTQLFKETLARWKSNRNPIINPSTVIKVCLSCNTKHFIELDHQMYTLYTQGRAPGLIQDCFPYLSDSQRELLMSGLCGTCYDRIYEEELI